MAGGVGLDAWTEDSRSVSGWRGQLADRFLEQIMSDHTGKRRVYWLILILSGIGFLLAGRFFLKRLGARPLTPGQVHERTIAPGEVQTYTLSLAEDRFAYVAVEQKGVDVVVRVLDAAGDTVMVVDSPNGRWGVEPVYFSDRDAGEYTISVKVLRPNDPRGPYRIALRQEGPSATSAEDRVRQVFLPWDREGHPGASIAVTKDGELIFAHGFGEAQLEYGVPITSSTVFPAASVSKQFTAFAVAMLVAEGRLSLDEDIREYLPEMPDFGETITIGHLVYHTSGLRNSWTLLALAGWRRDDVFTQNQILRVMSKQEDLNFPPGEEREYCNTGYNLLAMIVSRALGMPFSEWMEEEVFRPLGMTRTHFQDDHRRIVPDRAYSYQELPSGDLLKSVLNGSYVGGSGLFTTSEDLARWLVNLDEGTVGGEEVLRFMHDTRAVLDNGDTLDFAPGLNVGEYRGLRTVGHSGTDAGFRSYVVLFPDQNLSVNVLSNVGSVSPSRMALEVAGIYLEEEMLEAGGEEASEPSYLQTIERGEMTTRARRIDPIGPDLVDLEEYEGRFYSPELGTFYDLAVDGNDLLAKHLRHNPVLLTPIGSDSFAGGIHFFRDARFERDGEDRVSTMFVSCSGVRDVRFEKVDW